MVDTKDGATPAAEPEQDGAYSNYYYPDSGITVRARTRKEADRKRKDKIADTKKDGGSK
jgi:hypothetical protein